MDSKRFAFVAIAMLVVGAYFYRPAPSKAKIPAVESSEAFFARMSEKAAASGLEWEIAAYLLAVRDDAARIPGIADSRAWKELTADSVRAVARRRDAVIAWTRSDGCPALRVTFIGVIHKDTDKSTEQRDVTVRSQSAALSLIRGRSPGIGVVAIEAAGSVEGPLSWGAHLASAVDAYDQYQGIRLDRAWLERSLIAEEPVDADVSMIRSEGFPPVIYGEESAPNQLHYWLISRAAAGEIPSTDAAMLLNGLLKNLRSEMPVIRALEFLRRNGGSEAVITQGYAHGDDYARFMDDYDVTFETIVPVRPLERYR